MNLRVLLFKSGVIQIKVRENKQLCARNCEEC